MKRLVKFSSFLTRFAAALLLVVMAQSAVGATVGPGACESRHP